MSHFDQLAGEHTPCPIEGCDGTAGPPSILCELHWDFVPATLKAAVRREYRVGQAVSGPTEGYLAAGRAAIAAVEEQIDGEDGRVPALRALTIFQPWNAAIVGVGGHEGWKRWENRPWRCSFLPGEWIALHAGKRWMQPADPGAWLMATHGLCALDERQHFMGGITGLARVDRVVAVQHVRDTWATGPWCIHFAEVRKLKRPIPCRGYQGIWPVRRPTLLQLREQGDLPAEVLSGGRAA